MSFRRACCTIGLIVSGLAGLPAGASAQAFGIGPRLSFVRSDLPSATPAVRLFGGTIRLQASKHVVLEGALDYKSEYNENRTMRIRQNPFQASLLLFPARSTFAPYLLAGMGIYRVTTDTIGPAGVVLDTSQTQKTGWHLGGGAELLLVRHAAIYADYRFRFVTFGAPDADSAPINIPGLSRLKLSHRGSMWTSGLAFYF